MDQIERFGRTYQYDAEQDAWYPIPESSRVEQHLSQWGIWYVLCITVVLAVAVHWR